MEILRSGDRWSEPYRGSHYHFNSDGKVWWQAPLVNAKVYATSGHEDLVAPLLALRPDGGSFRITETRAVITKVQEGDNWLPVYVAEYELPIQFEHVDVLGANVNPLDLWPSFYDGARYSVKRGELWWRNPDEDVWQRTVEPLPSDLRRLFDRVKPSGGSLRITENGKVLVLIEPQPMPGHMRGQYESLSTVQKRLIEIKVKTTSLLPVFLGEYHDGFELRPPERLTDPLQADEEAALVEFLKRYGDGVKEQQEEPFDPDDAIESLLYAGQRSQLDDMGDEQ